MENRGERESDKLLGLSDRLQDDDDTLDFQPMKTAFEKSLSTTQHKTRKGRTFGSKAKGGDGSNINSEKSGRFRGFRQTFFGSVTAREALELEQENAMLADESSPEPSWRGHHALSEDQICDFGDLFDGHQQAPDLFPNAREAADEPPLPTKKSVQQHVRSASTAARPQRSRSFVFHSRSTSSIPQLQPPPQLPSTRRLLHRSHSLALGGPIPDIIPSPSNPSWSPAKREDWEENVDPNDLAAIEKTDLNDGRRDRKMLRGSRRHSITAVHPSSLSTGTRTASSGSSLASSATHLPSDLNWLAPRDVMASPAFDLGNYSESLGAFSVLSQGSSKSPTEERSVASSNRKRGVSGSPILSDEFNDDWLTLSSSSISENARRNRSRSRIFSPLPGETMPMAPSLARQLNDDQQPSSETKRRRSEMDYGGRGDAMDLDGDDSSDDEQSQRKTTPDSSFESVTNMVAAQVEPTLAPTDDKESKLQRILDNMPSIEDLNYLIQELHDQQLQQGRKTMFGFGDVWKVTPPSKVWTSQRRVAFSVWAKAHLGFTIRSVGMGFTYLQISKSKGAELLSTLEAALVEYAPAKCTKNQGLLEESLPVVFCSYVPNNVGVTKSSQDELQAESSHSSDSLAPLAVFHSDASADELVDRVYSLSLAAKVPTSASRSVLRTATLRPVEGIQRDGGVRLSVESSCSLPKTSRPSFEGTTHSMDLNLHFYGDSPRVSLGRPPKMSIGSSVCSMDTSYKARGSFGRIIGTPCSDDRVGASLHFVTTPLVGKDRGWGSRPIDGKDWGASDPCNIALLAELVARFERACGMEGSRETFAACHIGEEMSQRDVYLDFDQECDVHSTIDVVPSQSEAARKLRKRMDNFNKRKRLTVFAAATGARASLPARHTYALANVEREPVTLLKQSAGALVATCKEAVTNIFSYLTESELSTKVTPVCKEWSDWATLAHVQLLLTSVQRMEEGCPTGSGMERSWHFIHKLFPWARYLAEGGAKKVYKVHNSVVNMEEAVSVMDTHHVDSYQILANELAISVMLSSLVRRGICPNFLSVRGVFTGAFPPPETHWGSEELKCPNGTIFTRSQVPPDEPQDPEPSRFQYIRMELINEGDAEELIKRQDDERFPPEVAQSILFQMAFGLHVAADKFSVKHYDLKLLNIFIQRIDTVAGLKLRYGLGSHVFALRMRACHAYIAKMADYGTSNVSPDTNGLPVTIGHFTTIENTPFDFMVLGDDATQGHEHDSFGLGLCMLQLFTGSRPYEEILEKVFCPPNLKRRLKAIWENESVDGYSVIRSVIFDGVDVDDDGNVVEGDPDETLYHTFYRFLVLFGIPKVRFQEKTSPRVWKAIIDTLEPSKGHKGKLARKKSGSDLTQFGRDCKKYSIHSGNHPLIARARDALMSMEGGMELLLSLCDFNPSTRATAMDVLNSPFMQNLRESPGATLEEDPAITTYSYMSYATQR